MPLRLLETQVNSGNIFTATFIIVEGTGAQDQANDNLDPTSTGTSRPILGVANGDSVIVTYADRESPSGSVTARVDIEDDPPEFTNIGPSDGSRVNVSTTLLTATVQDNRAGVNKSKRNYAPGGVGSIGFALTVNGDVLQDPDLSSGDVTVTETPAGSGVFVVTYSIASIPLIRDAVTTLGDTEIKWRIFAEDQAGNKVTLPADSGDTSVFFTVTFNNQAPAISTARATSSTQVEVTFDRPMNPASIAPGDFLVNGVQPSSVTFTSDPAVLILVVADLPSDTPSVQVVGEVLDTGGNPLTTATAVATDAIPPTLTITIDENFTTGPITISVVPDEPIVGSLPTRIFNRCEFVATTCVELTNPTVTSRIVTPQLNWTFDIAAGLRAGLYTVQLTAEDVAGNLGIAGVSGDARAAGAITFQIDTAMRAAQVRAPDLTNLDDGASTPLPLRDTFVITIDWTAEGSEYAQATGDTHDSVKLTKAVLDAGGATERDLLGQTSTQDKQNFSVVILGITTGAHTLTFNGEDELGHSLATDKTVSFEVTQAPDFVWSLQPGTNLMSVPRDPANRSIDSILGAIPEVDLIFTREGNRTAGWWQPALPAPPATSPGT